MLAVIPMKEDTGKPNVPPEDKREIKSVDIPNAHAAGDGALGRTDEKLGSGDTKDGDDNGKKENERTPY